jgi:NADH-quinone oxidoreductase subunit A
VRFYLVAISFLVFDVELLFLYPWAASRANPAGIEAAISEQNSPSSAAVMLIDESEREAKSADQRWMVFGGVMFFIALVVAGFVYDWRKGVFRWR